MPTTVGRTFSLQRASARSPGTWITLLPAIALIILAGVLPGVTNDGRYAREMAAAKAIATIQTAESQYCSQFGQYATSLAQLGPPASGAPGPNSADLIDRDLATGEKGGFKFVLQQASAGYALEVTPTAFGTSGMHTYYSNQCF